MKKRWLAVLLFVVGGCAATPKPRPECPGWSRYPMVNMLRATGGNVCGHCDRCRDGAGPLSETMREMQDTMR